MRQALVLVAHADDETLGAGGLVQHLRASGWGVSIAIASDGIVTVRGGRQDNRAAAAAACAALGLDAAPRFLGYPDQRLETVAVADIANAVVKLGVEPDLVVTHADTDLNRDHRIVAEAARIFARPKRRPVALLACEIPADSSRNGHCFAADWYLPLSDEMMARKQRAFACYENEAEAPPSPRSPEGLRTLAAYRGMECGVRLAEAFHVVRGVAGLLP